MTGDRWLVPAERRGGEIYGVEGEFTARPTDALTVFGGFTFLKAEYTSFPAAQVNVPTCTPAYPAPPVTCSGGNATIFVDASGNRLIRTPNKQFNLGASYTIRPSVGGELVLNGNAYYQGGTSREPLNRVTEPSVTLVDASVSWTPDSEAFTFTVWGRNLLDQVSDLTALTSANGDNRSYAPPRTYGVRVSASF